MAGDGDGIVLQFTGVQQLLQELSLPPPPPPPSALPGRKASREDSPLPAGDARDGKLG